MLLILLEKLPLLLCRRWYLDAAATLSPETGDVVAVINVVAGADSCLVVPVVAARLPLSLLPHMFDC